MARDDELIAVMRQFEHGTRQFAAALLPALQRAGAAMQACYDTVYPRLRAAYTAAGEPYGPDDAAMYRWLREVGAAVRAVEGAEQERVWQLGLARIRDASRRPSGGTDGA